MTIPNKLTITRLFLTPFVFVCWYLAFHLELFPKVGSLLLWILFVISEVTDLLDGYIARSKNLVSDTGKLMDPFSDVFLRITCFLCFVGEGLMPIWTLAIIFWRELLIIFMRMLLVKDGRALAANRGGKLKSLLYFLSGIGGFFGLTIRAWWPDISWQPLVLRLIAWVFVLAALAAVLSFAAYFRLYLGSDTHRKFVSE